MDNLKVSIDKSGSNISALTYYNANLKNHEPNITIYQSKYLNNIGSRIIDL